MIPTDAAKIKREAAKTPTEAANISIEAAKIPTEVPNSPHRRLRYQQRCLNHHTGG
jgi:hypothetical protein